MSLDQFISHSPEGGFVDSRDISGAVDTLALISRMRSEAHLAANTFRDLHVSADRNSLHELRGELAGARGVLARWALMVSHQDFRTIDLERVENQGDWDATSGAELAIGELAVALLMQGHIDGVVQRESPEAKMRITIDPTIVAGKGLVVMRRKRMLLTTKPQGVSFTDVRTGKPSSATAHVEIDKVSEFIVDLSELTHVSPKTSDYISWRARQGKLFELTGDPERIDAVSALEAGIIGRHRSVTPAVTTYYADRKYDDVRPFEAMRTDESVVVAEA